MAEFKGIGPEALLGGIGNFAEEVSRRELEEKYKNLHPRLRKILIAIFRHRSGF